MTLSPDQLAAIDRHLRKDNWLQNEALITELTDHYANALADRMGQGIPFETALWDVHKEFGGRKGLLKMEEEYGKTQAKNAGRLGWMLFKSYYRMPRLPWVFGTFGAVYALTLLVNQLDAATKAFLFGDMTFIVFMVVLAALYITSFWQLMRPEALLQAGEGGLRPGIYIGQGVAFLLSLSFFARMFGSLESLVSRYPLPFALLVSMVLIYEAASKEALIHNLRQNRRQTV